MLSPRAIAHQILLQVDQEFGYPDRLLQVYLERYEHIDPRDKGLVTELVFGVLRWQARLDAAIESFSTVKLKKINPVVKTILRVAIYQLLFLDRIPPSAAVNEAVTLAKSSQPDYVVRFVNGVLRKICQQVESLKHPEVCSSSPSSIAEIYSHPVWLVETWIKEIGVEETVSLCKANNETPDTIIRVNTLKITSDDLAASLRNEDFLTETCKLAPNSLKIVRAHAPIQKSLAFKEGLFQIQDEASQLICHLLGPMPGETVLDACAGFGGKTSLFAQLMQNKGKIAAVDLSSWKVSLLRENIRRLGISIVDTRALDARELREKKVGQFDKIFLDVPCSGFGVLRRKPDIKWKRRPGDVYRLSKLQGELLESLSSLLKPGGVLIYATCTLLKIENESVVESFLHKHPDFCIEPVSTFLPGGEIFDSGGYFYSWPHRHGTDGFFAARLKRIK